ncbi:conserved Plasmodium protein, unknown function [Babesia microti strain RI]|uniref:Uncharacterized protein n=1 Tax=Babesia microti (strain RI) TaxID=1133968 RepID=A0A0K3AM46_BABMR|nr:conserved Plasmodium protein, unknown function [Babesia microti strain RI]CTQ40819.1 conserved Plasmodium protein, unknown function [Babesia microti strain RI]|eukprot:XP_012648830.1 conserved Plasmodium protein, unknown function [Babesia microti strain RI]
MSPRFQLFNYFRINYYSFHLKKERFYDYMCIGISSALVGYTAYLAFAFVANWRTTMKLLRYHQDRMECERKRLLNIVRDARNNGIIK